MKYTQKIKQAVDNNLVSEPFRARDFMFLRCPSYLSKQAVGYGRYSVYFIKVASGL